MFRRLARLVSIFRRAFWEWQHDNPTIIAGGLSFFALFSLIPLTLITFSIANHLFGGVHGGATREWFLSEFADMVSPEVADSVSVIISHARFSMKHAGLLSVVILLWAGSRIFIQLQRALSAVWHVPVPDTSRLQKAITFLLVRSRAVLATFGLGIVTFAFLLLDVAMNSFRDFVIEMLPSDVTIRFLPPVTWIASLILFTVLFAVIYRWLPDKHPGWPAVWSGAVVASILFAFGRAVLSIYLRRSNVLSLFGAAGSVIVVLIWVYYSMHILLFGAKFAWVLSVGEGKPLEPILPGDAPEKSF